MDLKNFTIAYAYKSKKELKSALFVYRIITRPFLVRFGKLMLDTALTLRIPIKPFTGFMFRHFCGGEKLDEVINISDCIEKFNVKVIPDFSKEGASEESAYEELISEVKKVIDISAENPNIPFAVFKPTGLIQAEYLKQHVPIDHSEIIAYRSRLDEIFGYAAFKKTKVFIDAEDYWYQDRIDEMVLDFMRIYNKNTPVVFTTLQMYRHDRLDYLKTLTALARREGFKLGIKFVRGAYMEKERKRALEGSYPDPIHPNKEITDKAFDDAITYSVENIDTIDVFCGTHNEKSILNLVNEIEKQQIAKNDPRIWFSQLYGMRDNQTFNLAAEGYNVAKYLPYGPIREVMPYLVRRAEENSSMGSQAGEEIRMLKLALQFRNPKNKTFHQVP
ncbi:MAG TPA: proline dehydrogenase family protein [Bacteroidales bacterium]|nr:proline dehydrogenase family protein [Bacteroidales bacterium]